MGYWNHEKKIEDFIGKTFIDIKLVGNNEVLIFKENNGNKYEMSHMQD